MLANNYFIVILFLQKIFQWETINIDNKSSLNLRWFSLVVLGLGAPLSRLPWKGAIWMHVVNDWMKLIFCKITLQGGMITFNITISWFLAKWFFQLGVCIISLQGCMKRSINLTLSGKWQYLPNPISLILLSITLIMSSEACANCSLLFNINCVHDLIHSTFSLETLETSSFVSCILA